MHIYIDKTIERKKLIKLLIIVLIVVAVAAAAIYGINYKRNYYDRYYDPNVNDAFFGWQRGTCTHDESYAEPVLPNGRYYPDGDVQAAFYLEVTDNKYYQFVPSDGNVGGLIEIIYNCDKEHDAALSNSDNSWFRDFRTMVEKNEFKVITCHDLEGEPTLLCSEWIEYDHKYMLDDGVYAYPGEKYLLTASSSGGPISPKINFEDDGSVSIEPFGFFTPDMLNGLSPDEKDFAESKLVYCGNDF